MKLLNKKAEGTGKPLEMSIDMILLIVLTVIVLLWYSGLGQQTIDLILSYF